MNWLDLVFIGIVGVSALRGLKIGLIRAGFTALGIFVGSILGGQLSNDIDVCSQALIQIAPLRTRSSMPSSSRSFSSLPPPHRWSSARF